MDSHNFWKDKPVGLGHENSPISVNILSHLKAYELSKDYTIDYIQSEDDVSQVINLIDEHYICSTDGSVKLLYPSKFLRWYIFYDIQNSDNVIIKHLNKIIGFVHGKTFLLNMNGKVLNVLGINFLCVHRNHRKMQLANIMIEEITKKGLIRGLQVGIFTGSKELPFKFSDVRFYHRPINLRKLVDMDYLSKKIFFNNLLYFEIKKKERRGTRRMVQQDLEEVQRLLKSEQKIHEVFTLDQLQSLFLMDNKIYSYVYENRCFKEFFSFYELNTLFKDGSRIKTAHLYYWSSDNPALMIEDCLVICKRLGYDLLNSTNISNNYKFLNGCGFLPGTGKINYYLYNYKSDVVEREEINYIMF